ncbi:hypothetical protein QF041_001477 [Paenibacillus sp. W2I17]|nr:hypothetical protein [Paenibacillus sp. W2I17]
MLFFFVPRNVLISSPQTQDKCYNVPYGYTCSYSVLEEGEITFYERQLKTIGIYGDRSE